ncbi:hypothetical protein LXL04_020354 [Taraxacum kok-saghyz]
MPEVKEIIVVCDPSYRDIFEGAGEKINVGLKFALPGKERQDPVYSGLQAIDLNSELACIHDSARPLVTCSDVQKVLNDGLRVGASVLGVPAKATIKEANSESFVVKTLDRKNTLGNVNTNNRFGVLIRLKGMLFDFLGLYWSNKVILQPFFSMIGRQGQFRKAAYVCFWGRVLLISLLWWQQQMIRYASSYSHLEYSRYAVKFRFWGRGKMSKRNRKKIAILDQKCKGASCNVRLLLQPLDIVDLNHSSA